MTIDNMRARFFGVLAIGLVGLGASCRHEPPVVSKKQAKLVEVDIARVGRRDFRDYVEIRGMLAPLKTTTVVSQLESRVVNCDKQGERVAAGRVVARLDARPAEQRACSSARKQASR